MTPAPILASAMATLLRHTLEQGGSPDIDVLAEVEPPQGATHAAREYVLVTVDTIEEVLQGNATCRVIFHITGYLPLALAENAEYVDTFQQTLCGALISTAESVIPGVIIFPGGHVLQKALLTVGSSGVAGNAYAINHFLTVYIQL